MNIKERREKFQSAKVMSTDAKFEKEDSHFQEIFPDLIIQEEDDANEILRSVQEIASSSQSYSSDSSSEEEKKEFKEENRPKPVYRKSKVRKSILKSQILTHKRQSKQSKGFNKNMKKVKTLGDEGRLPIRRPSNADAIMKQTTFNKGQNRFSILNSHNEEIGKNDFRDDKNDLDYITVEEHGDKEDLNSFLSRSLFTNKFQLVWAFLLFLAHTYHLLALFYYLGLSSFPKEETLSFQIFFEFVLIIDLILRF